MAVVKQGKQTTEFIFTIAGTVFTLLVATGIITPDLMVSFERGADMANQIEFQNIEAVMDGLARIVSMIMGGSMVNSYSASRGHAKSGGPVR